jgi:hypothetical protein
MGEKSPQIPFGYDVNRNGLMKRYDEEKFER